MYNQKTESGEERPDEGDSKSVGTGDGSALGISSVPFIIAALPVMLAGCMAGWFLEAFKSGVAQGRADYRKFDPADSPNIADEARR